MPMMRGGMVMDDVAFMAAPAPAAMAFREKGGATARKSELQPVQRVRKLFPETWLWKSATTYVNLSSSSLLSLYIRHFWEVAGKDTSLYPSMFVIPALNHYLKEIERQEKKIKHTHTHTHTQSIGE